MGSLWQWLSGGGFMPHGHCYYWRSDILWLHVISDAAIALAYYSIPLTLVYFVRQRRDIPFSGVFVMFAVFIFACGTNHVVDIWTTWHPQYGIEGLLKAFTALVSVATAVMMVRVVPQALMLRSPTELEAANQALRRASSRHARTEAILGELRQRFDLLAEHAAQTLWIADPAGAIEYESPAFARRTGSPLKGSAQRAQDWLARVHPDDRERLREAFFRDLPTAGLDDTYRVMGTDGRYRWVREKAFFVQAAPGTAARVIGLSEDISAEREATERLAWLDSHDALTGLPARRVLLEWLDARVHAPAPRPTATLVYVDVDHLTLVNLQAGHDTGDAVLRHVANALQDTFGAGAAARVCGGSFAVLLDHTAVEAAAVPVEAFLATLSAHPLRTPARTTRVTATAVLIALDAAHDARQVLREAHVACVDAKRGGRNRVHRLPPASTGAGTAALAGELHQALAEQRIALAWQPIAAPAGSGGPARIEILARLGTRDGRVLTPSAFLGAAREADLLGALDREVIARAVRLLAPPEARARIAACHLNVSMASVEDDGFEPFITQLLESTGVPARKLCFELSEGELAPRRARAARFITWAHALGAAIAIERCNAGAATAGALRGLPVSFLKMDLDSDDDVLADPLRRTLVTHAVELAHLLGAQLIVGAVESPRAREAAHALGAAYCQGFAIGPPRLLDPLPDGRPPWE